MVIVLRSQTRLGLRHRSIARDLLVPKRPLELRKKIRPRIPKEFNVRPPSELALRKAEAQLRSAEAQQRRRLLKMQHNLAQYVETVPIYRSKRTYEELESDAKRSKNVLPGLLRRCKQRLIHKPIAAGSKMWQDKNGRTLAAYFGYRVAGQKRVGVLPLKQQYVGQTQADFDQARARGENVRFDGLDRDLLADTNVAIQRLASQDQPVLAPRDARHMDDRYVLDSYLHTFVDGKTGEVVRERRGVHHLVHAWTAQGHPNGRLVPSADMLGGGVAANAVEVETYFYATRTVAMLLAEMFKAIFPEEYQKYRKAFDAGVWIESDPGPWLGRAIVYKLDVHLHFDGLDGGPTATFPIGSFTGGTLELPQLWARLEYGPGAVLLSLSGVLAHRVTEWQAVSSEAQEQTGCTPGRIGNVFFFPENSLRRLSDRPPGWGKRTAYGRYTRTSSTS